MGSKVAECNGAYSITLAICRSEFELPVAPHVPPRRRAHRPTCPVVRSRGRAPWCAPPSCPAAATSSRCRVSSLVSRRRPCPVAVYPPSCGMAVGRDVPIAPPRHRRGARLGIPHFSHAHYPRALCTATGRCGAIFARGGSPPRPTAITHAWCAPPLRTQYSLAHYTRVVRAANTPRHPHPRHPGFAIGR